MREKHTQYGYFIIHPNRNKKKEKRISKNERYNKKWCIADNALPVI